jgi:hypothetical protein
MADNISTKDGLGATKVLRTTDTAGVHQMHHIISALPADPLGATADAVVTTDTTGTISAKMRGLIKWAYERMPVSLGQKTMGNSLAVVLASDQSAVNVYPQATLSGGSSVYRNLDLKQTGQVVKGSAANLYSVMFANGGAAVRYLKLYDKATAASSSDTPVMTIPLLNGLTPLIWNQAVGIAFPTGLSVRATTGLADADATDPTTNDVMVFLGYK